MLPQSVRMFAYSTPVDLRKSFNGLALITKQSIGRDPMDGSLYCFINKRKNRVKILWWDQNGYCLLYKRLSGARFVIPNNSDGSVAAQMDAQELAGLLRGILTKKP